MWAHNFKCQLGGSLTCAERPGQQAGPGFTGSGQAAMPLCSKFCTCIDQKQLLTFCHQEPPCLKVSRVLFCPSSSPQTASALTDHWFIWYNGKDQKMHAYTIWFKSSQKLILRACHCSKCPSTCLATNHGHLHFKGNVPGLCRQRSVS